MTNKNWLKSIAIVLGWQFYLLASYSLPVAAQEQNQPSAIENDPNQSKIEIDPKILQDSPVLQKWLEKIPNVDDNIRNDPSFRTRLRLGYSQFPSSKDAGGLNLGLEDLFLGRSGLTFSTDYQTSFNGDRQSCTECNRVSVGGDLHYYVLPLGNYFNISPVVGYRYLETGNFTTEGINLGAKIILSLSRNGGADLTLTQSFVSPGGSEEVGITSVSVGVALNSVLRLSTDLEKQNSSQSKDSRIGIGLEFMLRS
jgi:hypothetical protein